MDKPSSLHDIVSRTVPPAPFREGENLPWDEPAFSARMLREHLSQEHDLASRRQRVIEGQCDWLHETLLDRRPASVLDLACGPGLYLHQLARLGHRGRGIDFAPAAIEHARAVATRDGLDCGFSHADIRRAPLGTGFELALLLYGQINVFRREHARDILERAHAALRSGGRLVLEPQSAAAVRGAGRSTSWYSSTGGLFSPRPHLVLCEHFFDDATRTTTERWHVIDVASGAVTRYAQSSVAYDPVELSGLLRDVGFTAVATQEALGTTPWEGAPGLYVLVATR